MKSSPIPFIVSLLALFLFFNACRRMLVACAPLLLQKSVFSQTTYGFMSSLTSILFGVVRFGAFFLMERFPLDTYVCVTSIIAFSVFLFRDPTLHRSELYPPFGPSFLDQSLLFSLLAVTSNLGSVASTQLMYSFQSPSHVFGLLAQFGAACAMAFYVFYPEESKKQKEESKSVSLSPRRNETLRLSLCFLAQFLVQL